MDYESGKAIPNNQVMGKIERALGEYIHVITCKEKILKNSYYLAITSGTSRHVFCHCCLLLFAVIQTLIS